MGSQTGGQVMGGQNISGAPQAMFQSQQYGNIPQGMNQNYPGYTGQPTNQQAMMGGFQGQQQFPNQQVEIFCGYQNAYICTYTNIL